MSDTSAAQAGKGSLGVPPVEGSGRNGSIDPTRNVLDLVQAAVQRIDDLRTADNLRINEKLDSESKHLREMAELRAAHASELQVAEAKRIDAIRAVDVQAVAVATDRATAAAGVLAAQVNISAETQRTLVATSAAALADQLQTIIRPIGERLASLEKAQYEGAGKAVATDPVMSQLVQEMRDTQRTLALGSGATQKGADTSRIAFLTIGALVGLAGLAIAAISLVTR